MEYLFHSEYGSNILIKNSVPLSANVAFQTDWLPGFGMSNTTDATCGAGSAYLSGAPEIKSSFGGVRVAQAFFYIVLSELSFVGWSFFILTIAFECPYGNFPLPLTVLLSIPMVTSTSH